MSRLTRDGTAEYVLRDQVLRLENGNREIITLPVLLTTSRIGNVTGLIHTLLYVMTIHTFIRISSIPFPSRMKKSTLYVFLPDGDFLP